MLGPYVFTKLVEFSKMDIINILFTVVDDKFYWFYIKGNVYL